MNRAVWIVMMVSVALAGSIAAVEDLPPAEVMSDTSMEPVTAPPSCPESWRIVRLHCRGKSEGVALGSYGGTDFFLACNGDRVTTSICTSGNDYRYIAEGQAPGGPIARCAGSGSSVQVNEFCGSLHLTIN